MATLNSIFFDSDGQPTPPTKEKTAVEARIAAACIRFAAGERNALADPFFRQFSQADLICVASHLESVLEWLIEYWEEEDNASAD